MSSAALLAELLKDTAWQAFASCRPASSSLPSEAFIPPLGSRTAPAARWSPADALAACEGCTVRQECADYAEANQIRFGVWGGKLLGRAPDTPNRPTSRARIGVPR